MDLGYHKDHHDKTIMMMTMTMTIMIIMMEWEGTSSRSVRFKKLQYGAVLDLGEVFQLVKDVL